MLNIISMSASGPPLCRICQKEHWMRDPHILPADAPAEVRAKRIMLENNVKSSSAIKTGNPTITLPAPAKASTTNAPRALGIGQSESKSEGARRRAEPLTAGGARTQPKARDGTAEAPQTNTSREGRRVLKAEGESPDATRTAGTPRPNPTTPPGMELGASPGNRQSRAAKPSPGKRKPRTKANKRKGKP